MTLAEHALMLAERGLAVFPLKARDKAPVTKHGFKDATTDLAVIKGWWEGWPEQNIGIATGERSGVFVVDVDGEQGEASLEALCDKHGPLPPTVESLTGKGRHIWFRYPVGVKIGSTAKRLGQGLDTRGNDGYVVAPPSIHPTGKGYRWAGSEDHFADAPDWLIDLLTAQRPEPKKLNGNGHHGHKADILKRLPAKLAAQVHTAEEPGKRS